MKIRTDFVTNSSSSNYCVKIKIVDKAGKEYKLKIDPGGIFDHEDFSDVRFTRSLSEIKNNNGESWNVINCETVEELCRFLTSSIEDDLGLIQDEAGYFTKKVKWNIKDISLVKKVIVTRTFEGWGEGSINIPLRDEKLLELAKKVNSTKGGEKENAKKEMLEYIHTSNSERAKLADYDEFGYGFSDFRYYWDDGKSIDELSLDLVRGHLLTSEGIEYRELDAENGKLKEFAYFFLSEKPFFGAEDPTKY